MSVSLVTASIAWRAMWTAICPSLSFIPGTKSTIWLDAYIILYGYRCLDIGEDRTPGLP